MDFEAGAAVSWTAHRGLIIGERGSAVNVWPTLGTRDIGTPPGQWIHYRERETESLIHGVSDIVHLAFP